MAHDGEVLLNRNEGQDVLHPQPQESCNTDQATHRGWVDQLTAAALVDKGAARWCALCGPDSDPTLSTRSDAP